MEMKKKNLKKKSNDDDIGLMSARSMENLKTKEKIELMKFLNEQLTQPLVFYSSYYRKHGKNILQRNYNKKSKDKIDDDDNDDDDENDEEGFSINDISNGTNPKDKISQILAPGKSSDPNNKTGNSDGSITYSKRFDEATCYFDLKKKAHAFPMKWFEANKTFNDYQQIPRITKTIDLNSEDDRNVNFSLFNRQNISKSKWEKMDRNLQAKYYIYENPLPEIQNFIMNTNKRNHQYEHNIQEKIKSIYGTEPTANELQQIREKQRQESIEASQKANQRIKEQFLWQLDCRNGDLQHLLEGQQTALDAIRLKEYLLLKPIPVRSCLNISNKDKRRIGNLLSNR